MNRLYIILAAVFLAGCSGTNGASETTAAFAEKEFNFGVTTGTDTLRHVFNVKNTGTDDLLIDTLVASCGCISSSWTKTPVKPGESGAIRVAFLPTPGEFGTLFKSIAVSTNTKAPITLIRVRYEVKHP